MRSQASADTLVTLAVQRVLGEIVHRHGAERVETDVERHALDVESLEQLLREVQAGGGRGRRPGLARVHRLVAAGILERLSDVRRQRRLAGGLAVQSQPPAPFAEMLEQLHRAVAATRLEAARRPREAFPEPILVETLEEQHLALRRFDRNARRHDTRVVDHHERVADHVRQLCEPPLVHPLGQAFIEQQSRLVAARHGMLGNQRRGEVVLELPRFHPAPKVPLPDMDDGVVERAKERVGQRAEGAALDALLTRAREQVETLAAAALVLEETLPGRVGDAVRDEAQPMARNLAEIRGLMNGVIRKLERIDGDLLADRNARVDDLSLLVDLISSGWKGVDARIARMESLLGRLEQGLQESRGAVVYRMEDRRPDAATS